MSVRRSFLKGHILFSSQIEFLFQIIKPRLFTFLYIKQRIIQNVLHHICVFQNFVQRSMPL